MGAFWQVLGGVLIAVVLILVLTQQGKDVALVLSVAVCSMVLLAAAAYLNPVMEFIGKLQTIGSLNENAVSIMVKAVGIGLTGEIASLVCTDAGSGALGKTVQILSAAVILWLSLPLMNALLELLQQMMGDV